MTRLAALRRNIDVSASPVRDRPGLLMRDPCRYAEGMVIVPDALVPLLTFFDGRHTEEDMRERLVRMADGDVRILDVVDQLCEALSRAGFLEDDAYQRLRQDREAAFAAAPVREPAHAGSGYPEEPAALREQLDSWLGPREGDPETPAARSLVGIAAPHVSPEGGVESYRAAYRVLGSEVGGRTFVVLGTSHYGAPERFGLTRKPFRTPQGDAAVDVDMVDFLADRGGDAVLMDDYVHAVEHSIEFQVVFLQRLFGPGLRIVPVLCGPFVRRTLGGGLPEEDSEVGRVLEALGALDAREGGRLVWVLGVDMAHIGRRYGDAFTARAGKGPMAEVAQRDRERIDRLQAGDAAGFWSLVQEQGDDLRWCGSSPLYTFLRAVAGARGELLRYEQWNIDAESVVSFGGLAFTRA